MASRIVQVHSLRVGSAICRAPSRAAGTLAPSVDQDVTPMSAEEQAWRDRHVPRIGNRDIVGFGRNGNYYYKDCITYPYPAIRWEQNTTNSDALMKKAEGDWKTLSLDEKKALYRHSFCQTYAEIQAPDSNWKIVFGLFMVALSASCWVYMFLRNNAYNAMLPSTITKEHHIAQEQRMIAQRQGVVQGITSKWDFETNDWKKK